MADINPYAPGEISTQKITSRPIEYPGYQIKLSITYDMEYLTEATLRVTSQDQRPNASSSRRFSKWLSVLLFGSASMLGFAAPSPQYLVSTILLMVAIYLALSSKIVEVLVRRRLKSWPQLNKRSSFLLTDEGVFSESEEQKVRLLWYAFTDVIDLQDGVVLCQSKQMRYWFPFTALENAADSSILYPYILSRLSPEKVADDGLAVKQTESNQNASFIDNEVEPPIRYTVVANEEYELEKLARYREYKRSLPAVALAYLSIFALASMAVYFAVYNAQYWTAGFLAVIAVFIMFFYKLRSYFALWDLRSARHYKESFLVSLSDDGVSSKSSLQEANIEWKNFSEVAAFPDGVLLMMWKSYSFWIRFDALENQSDANRLYEFVASRIARAKELSKGQTERDAHQDAGSLI